MAEQFIINKEYGKISELFFAVWNVKPPINYIWVDFDKCKIMCGQNDEICDLAAERRNLNNQGGKFVELISYDESGEPILNFDSFSFEQGAPFIDLNKADALKFLAVLQKIDVLAWRNSFPSKREGISWRVDIYSNNGSEKHSNGQARFPLEWAEFGKAISTLVQSAGANQK